MKKINIAIITGTRAEYGIWKPVLAAIQKSKKLRLQLVVTGMHLQKQFGHTIDDITEPISAKVPMYDVRSSAFRRSSPAEALARGISGMSAAFDKLKPDLVMVLGDRLEILAAASAALACQLPLAHLHGGETAPGQWDEQIRHAVTKMSHLHFCATKKAAKRIQQMGEDPRAIHIVGAPALDSIHQFLATHQSPPSATARANVLPSARPALLLLHPSSPDDLIEQQRTSLLLRALEKQNLPFTAIGPNNDPGHAGILRAYRTHKIPLNMSLTQSAFWQQLASSSLLIGNSSAGILEAASFGIPVINLGDRQKGRERNPNVLDVPWSAGQSGMQKAIRRALTDTTFRRQVARRQNLYGDGHAAERIVGVLESLILPLATAKQFYDRR